MTYIFITIFLLQQMTSHSFHLIFYSFHKLNVNCVETNCHRSTTMRMNHLFMKPEGDSYLNRRLDWVFVCCEFPAGFIKTAVQKMTRVFLIIFWYFRCPAIWVPCGRVLAWSPANTWGPAIWVPCGRVLAWSPADTWGTTFHLFFSIQIQAQPCIWLSLN